MRSWKQRLWSLLLCGAMLLTLLPPPALAEEPEDGIPYIDENGVWQMIPINKVEMLDSNNTGNLELTAGQFYFVKEHETVSVESITAFGGYLILGKGSTLNVGSLIVNALGVLFISPPSVGDASLNVVSELNNDGTLYNRGMLNNDGTLYNRGTLNNEGTLYNRGTLNNEGTLYNDGTLYNEGTLNNENGGNITGSGEFQDGGTAKYGVTVEGGSITSVSEGGTSGVHFYAAGITITIQADTPEEDKEFSGWTSAPEVTFNNSGNSTATFVMPSESVTVTAHFKEKDEGGDGSEGDGDGGEDGGGEDGGGEDGGDEDGGDPVDPEPPDPVDPEPPKPVDPPSGGGSYTPPTYKPDVTQPDEGGTVSVTPSRPERGDTVTVKPKPDEGYELDSITVTDRDGKSVEVTAKPNRTYTFKQPAGKVKIEVTYKPIETPWNNPFADVSEDDWHYEAVRFVQEQGLMSGYSDGRFAPEDTLSRSQLAQILFNKEGRPVVNYLLQYDDVSTGTWYTEAVRWAASQGIVGGYGNGTFGPNDPITREQLAVMLWRYSGSPAATNEELYFSDESQISGYALEALRWAVENGILSGDGGRLGPQDQATRAQAAQMLKNFIENQEDT